MPVRAVRARYPGAGRSETSCRDGSQPNGASRLFLTQPHLLVDSIQRLVAQPNRSNTREEATRRRLRAEVGLDDLRKRLVVLLGPRQEAVGLHVDGNGLHGHALIVHLDWRQVNLDGPTARVHHRLRFAAMSRRLLLALVLLPAIGVSGVPGLRAADPPKPRIRAITGFVTIDAKSYPAQLEETVAFLSKVRDAVKAAGYDVAGIRISTQPFPEFTRGLSRDDAMAVLRGIGDLAAKLRFAPNIGPAMLKDSDNAAAVDLAIDVLSTPGNRLNANIIVAAEDGIHWNAVRQAAHIIKAVGERSPHGQGNFNFGATAMLKPFGPFYPGAWHPGGGPRRFAIGLEAANVVMDVFAREHDPRTAAKALTDALAVHLRAVETAATAAAAASGWTYAGLDPPPAPGGEASIGAAIESFIGAPFGSPGTETAAALITRAVKDVPVTQTGYSGLMIPVLEETTLTRRWTEGTYGLDSILSYSAVCAGGVDTVPLPGDTSDAVLAAIVGDVATLAFKWNKPLAARLLPAPGKKT